MRPAFTFCFVAFTAIVNFTRLNAIAMSALAD